MGCGSSKAAAETVSNAPPSHTPTAAKSNQSSVKNESPSFQQSQSLKAQVSSNHSNKEAETMVSVVPPIAQHELENKDTAPTQNGDLVSEIIINLDDMSEVDQVDPISPAPLLQSQSLVGDIDFQQYLNWPEIADLQSRYPELLEDEILEVFEEIDTDIDGLITRKQAEEVLYILEAKLGPSDTQNQPLTIIHIAKQEIAERALNEQFSTLNRVASAPKTKKAKKPVKFIPDDSATNSLALDDFAMDFSNVSHSGLDREELIASKFPEIPAPPMKKGFLTQAVGSVGVLSVPNSPASSIDSSSSSKGARNRYHVLDAGFLFHLDSHSARPPFTFDRRGGIDLKDRKLYVRDDGILELHGANGSAHEIISLRIKGEEEDRTAWIDAINEHMIFAGQRH